MRESNDIFNELFTDSTNLAGEIEEEIKVPRTVKRQKYRDNFEVDSPEYYFRLSIFNPFVDHFVVHLKDRFMKHKDVLEKIQNILPYIIVDIDEKSINESIEIILMQWPVISDVCNQIVEKEALLWKLKWIESYEKPRTFIDSLNFCDKTFFPNVHNILKVCATIPVTVASAERSFSTLKRIKTYLRNATGETRLNSLAALSIYREFEVNTEEVLDIFCEKNRRMML